MKTYIPTRFAKAGMACAALLAMTSVVSAASYKFNASLTNDYELIVSVDETAAGFVAGGSIDKVSVLDVDISVTDGTTTVTNNGLGPQGLGEFNALSKLDITFGSDLSTATLDAAVFGFDDPTLGLQQIILDNASLFFTGFRRANDVDVTVTGTRLPDPNVVPLPAGLPLLLAGLGGFAVLRRKQNA